jgi:hypothetical protein
LTVFSGETNIKYFYTIILSSTPKTDIGKNLYCAVIIRKLIPKIRNKVNCSRTSEILPSLPISEIMCAGAEEEAELPPPLRCFYGYAPTPLVIL